MAYISPYKISVPQAKLNRLKQKLALADFPDELEDANWDYGAPLADVKRLTARWHTNYDWRKVEAELNATLPQFTVDIPVDGFETLTIHFVHRKSEVDGAIPLLFAHGWPGSFDEVRKLIPDLVKGDKDTPAFHVVAPSLPNFGFSQGTKKV
jgi:pimeloyl-ACP methyl ester carboxylesterase